MARWEYDARPYRGAWVLLLIIYVLAVAGVVAAGRTP